MVILAGVFFVTANKLGTKNGRKVFLASESHLKVLGKIGNHSDPTFQYKIVSLQKLKVWRNVGERKFFLLNAEQ